MKYFTFFFIGFCAMNLNLLAQHNFNGEQLIQSFNGNSNIAFLILDFNNDEPLIGAEIFSKDSNKVLAQTNIDGKAIIEKFISMKFRIDYIGYNSYCFNLSDTTIDNIVVRLIPAKLYYGNEVDPYKGYSLNKNLDAIKDMDSGYIKLYCYSKPTEEQLEFARQFGFNFIIDDKKSSADKFNYNEEVLNFLDKKYNIQIRTKLSEICWRNIK